MKISQAGLDLIKQWESCVLTAYPDPGTGAAPWTIGWGHTGGVVPGMTISQEEADELLSEDVGQFEEAVNRLVAVPLSQNQFDALTSFTFNVGEGALERSTLLKKLNNYDMAGAAAQFDRWVKSGETTLLGLVRRRAAERKMFEGDSL